VVLFAGLLTMKLGAGPARAALAALAAGISNALWRLSIEIGAIVPALLLLLVGLWLAARARTSRGWSGAGLVMAASILVHQMVVVAAIAVSVWLAFAARQGRLRVGHAGAFVAAWGTVTIAGYMSCGWIAAGARTPADVLEWVLTVRSRSAFGEASAGSFAAQSLRGAAESWVSLQPLRSLRSQGWNPATVVAAAGAIVGLVGVGWAGLCALPGVVRACFTGDVLTGVVASAAIALVAFAIWYQPDNHIFWVFMPPLAAVLAARHTPRAGRGAAAAAVVLLALVAAVNAGHQILPARDPASAPYADLVAVAREHFEPGDVLVTDAARSQIGIGLVALPTFARVEILSLPRADDLADRARFTRDVAERLDHVTVRGTAVYALPEMIAALRALRPWVVPQAVGMLRGDTLYRMQPTAPPANRRR
jgi:hypothetical protein